MMTLMINKCSKIQTNVQCYGKILRTSLEVVISVLKAVLPWRERRSSSYFLFPTSRKLPLWLLPVCLGLHCTREISVSPGSPLPAAHQALCCAGMHSTAHGSAGASQQPSARSLLHFPHIFSSFLWLLILFFHRKIQIEKCSYPKLLCGGRYSSH